MRWGLWSQALAIDLGTANTRVWARKGGPMVREATAVAYARRGGRRPVAVGQQARELAQRQAEAVEVVEPIRRGRVSEFQPAVSLVRAFVQRALARRSLISPLAVVAAPAESGSVTRQALRSVMRAAGVSRVFVVAKSLAAAIGAGVPTAGEESVLVIDMGAGVTEVAVIAMGMATVARSLPFGGVDIDEAIRRFVWRRAGIALSRAAAEDLKLRVGAVEPALATGALDLSDVGPPSVDSNVEAGEIAEVMAGALEPVIDEIAWVVEQLAPKQKAEIAAGGGILTGGTALLRGLAELLAGRIGIPLKVADDPLAATVLGLGAIAGDLKRIPPDGERRVHLSVGARGV